ncbi:MAG: acylneuraminate cytidylyltransferase family protein [Humidesulfovibrio sp.]|uniref:acylneuraminate cytidylyltransferase family protein n=1 Tax=Humidesulfovibrio sp. TaxID=2910988 RepID=UPI0027FFFA18|nr:acylneuraminate cytidylyltransferase family protein [Humidesulfovibrio sp.]MDQ7834266.1 acylneuraminate cytidylyltransferase family protein [Humidesulfovibrio sp.]
MYKRFACIPARGGSVRVPRKNLLEINGKPLLAYAVDSALATGLFDEVFVNSDSDEILQVAERCGAQAYRRPLQLGRGDVFLVHLLHEMIKNMEWGESEMLAVLLPTCPLRRPHHIREAVELFEKHGGSHSVASVCEYETPIHLAQFVDHEGRLSPYFPDDYLRSTRSTDHPAAFRFNEAVVINSAQGFLGQNTLIGSRPLPYIMDPAHSIAIDYDYQVNMVSSMLQFEDTDR